MIIVPAPVPRSVARIKACLFYAPHQEIRLCNQLTDLDAVVGIKRESIIPHPPRPLPRMLTSFFPCAHSATQFPAFFYLAKCNF
jgi:hypothetical protein